MKSFVQFRSDYGNCIYLYFDFALALTDLCHTKVLGNIVHTEATKVLLLLGHFPKKMPLDL